MSKPYRRKDSIKLPIELKTANIHLQAQTDEKIVSLKPGIKVILAERVTYKKK